jgi:hypothetical protein
VHRLVFTELVRPAEILERLHFVKSPAGIDLPGIQERKDAARRAWIASDVGGGK